MGQIRRLWNKIKVGNWNKSNRTERGLIDRLYTTSELIGLIYQSLVTFLPKPIVANKNSSRGAQSHVALQENHS